MPELGKVLNCTEVLCIYTRAKTQPQLLSSCGCISEGKGKAHGCGTRDHPDAIPQLIVNNSSTIAINKFVSRQ